MWLPKDERRLLSGYYQLMGEFGKERLYYESGLTPMLARKPKLDAVTEYGESSATSEGLATREDVAWMKAGMKKAIEEKTRVEQANKMLTARKLITIRPHQHEEGVILIGMTLEGFDLGRRYQSRLGRSGLWFEQHKDHWLRSVLWAVGGSFLTLLTQRLTSASSTGVDHSSQQPTTQALSHPKSE